MRSNYHSPIKLLVVLVWLVFFVTAQSQTSFNISNKTTGDTLLTIDNAGNVGIGITTPAGQLDAVSADPDFGGSIRVGNADLSHYIRLYSGRLNNPSPIFMWNAGDPLRFATSFSAADEMMRIAVNGNIGIAVPDPTSRLDIQMFGNGAWQRAIRVLNPDMVADDGLLLVLGKSDASRNMGYMNFKFSDNDSEANRLSFGLYGVNDILNVVGSGNVGIGTTTPGEMLEVADTIYSSVGGFRFPDNTVQETAATGGGATSIDELSDANTGGNSIFLGSDAGINDDSSDNRNTAVGVNALHYNTTGNLNTANGYEALYSNISGTYNNANGFQSIYSNTIGGTNIGLGSYSLFSNTTGSFNVGIGHHANFYNQEGIHNTIIGHQAGRGNSAHNKSGNIFLGYQAGYNETGSNMLYIENSNSSSPLIWGDFSTDDVQVNGDLHITGNLTIDGNGSASSIDDLSDAISLGNSVFIGSGAGVADDGSNNQNSIVGVNAFNANTTGSANTANGFGALYRNTIGASNTGIGHYALFANIDGSSNIAIGQNALTGNTTGDFNIGIGISANGNNQEGSRNTILGFRAGSGSAAHNKTGNVFLGYQAGYNETTDNKLYIENSNSDSPLIGGDFAADEIYLNGNVGIGTTTPSAGLHLSGAGYPESFMFLEAAASADAGFRLYEGTTDKWHIFNNATLDGLQIYNDVGINVFFADQSSGNVGIGTTSPSSKLTVGTVECDILEINGGGDIAEPFDINQTKGIEAGMVLTIDSDNPGKLKISKKAYDRCVCRYHQRRRWYKSRTDYGTIWYCSRWRISSRIDRQSLLPG